MRQFLHELWVNLKNDKYGAIFALIRTIIGAILLIAFIWTHI